MHTYIYIYIYIYIYFFICTTVIQTYGCFTFTEPVLWLPGAVLRSHAGHAGWADPEPKRNGLLGSGDELEL